MFNYAIMTLLLQQNKMKNIQAPMLQQAFLSVYQQDSLEGLRSFLDRRVTRIVEPEKKSTYCNILTQSGPSNTNSLIQIQQFKTVCQKLKIDRYYVDSIIQTFCDLSATERSILFQSEIRQLNNRTSNYHIIESIVLARNNCIKSIKAAIDQFKQSIARISQLDELCMLMVHLRILTLFLIEAISDWSESLDSLFENKVREVRYEFRQVDIFSEIAKDAEFLKTTILKKYLKFPKGFDPLLIRLGKRIKEKRKQNQMLIVNYDQEDIDRFTLLIQLDPNLVSRLRNAEMTLIRFYSSKQQKQDEEKSDPFRRYGSQDASLSEFRSMSLQRQPNDRTQLCKDQDNQQECRTIEIDIKNINLPQEIVPASDETIKRSPGFISHRSNSRSSIQYKSKPKETDQEKITLPKTLKQKFNNTIKENPQQIRPAERRNHLMKKIRILNEQLKADMQHETEKYLRIFKKPKYYPSQPNIKTLSKSLNHLIKVLPSIEDIPQKSFRKKKVGARAQKFRLLKDIYCDGIQNDLEISLKIIKERASCSQDTRKKYLKNRRFELSEFESSSSESLSQMIKLQQRIRTPVIKVNPLKKY